MYFEHTIINTTTLLHFNYFSMLVNVAKFNSSQQHLFKVSDGKLKKFGIGGDIDYKTTKP